MLGKRIFDLRRKNGMSQEDLANKIGVTRQTVSNWENNETAPNPDQLKMLSNLFNASVDFLLDNETFITDKKTQENFFTSGYEYKSKIMVRGLPLVHINFGYNTLRKAKGIVAIGNIAKGVFALGGISAGIFSCGGISAGLISFGGISFGLASIGGLAVGLIAAIGGCAIAPIACGGFAMGLITCGAGHVNLFPNLMENFSHKL